MKQKVVCHPPIDPTMVPSLVTRGTPPARLPMTPLVSSIPGSMVKAPGEQDHIQGLRCQVLLVGTGKRAEPRAFCMARSTEPSMQPGGLTWSTRLACLGEVEARKTT